LWNKDNYSPNDISLAAFLFQNNFPWRIGLYGGLPTRILHFVAGLSPTVLMITGIGMWVIHQSKVWHRKQKILEPSAASTGAVAMYTKVDDTLT
jgi:uncharacterized iron-regulated membrane protein